MGRLTTRVREHFALLPLSRRMTLLVISVLAVALTLAGMLLIGILQRHLLGQVDRQLEGSAKQIAEQVSEKSLPSPVPLVPSEYYLQVTSETGEVTDFLTLATEARAGRPRLHLTDEQFADILEDGGSRPRTVRSSMAGASWRAISLPVVRAGAGSSPEVLTVALPLVAMTETLSATAVSFLFAASALIAAAWAVGHYLVRRSLQPLRTIETVAGAIAAGDLTRRIPSAPLTTEVGSLSASLNTMLVQIERSFAATEESEARMRRFVADASHELRTPLAAIQGYGELYRMGAVDPASVPDVMGRIEAESRRMGTLVEDLLTLAKLDDRPVLQLETVDLVQVASQTESDMHAIDPTRSVTVQGVHTQRAPSQLSVLADRDQITQVFLNLAGNVVRYTPKGSPVEILIGSAASQAIVEFRDHGPGIPLEDRAQVFERFYRTGKSRSRELGGSGLGLAIVRSIVESHGGTVSLWETDPNGLTVRVTLPLEPKGDDEEPK